MLYTWSIIRARMMESAAAGGWEWTSTQAGLPFTIAVVFFAVGLLVGGRIQDKIGPRWVVTTGGFVSDKIGRVNTLFVICIIQTLNMFGFMFYSNLPALIVGIIGIGLCFGALLSVFPALTAEQYGLKNYGANYGVVYLAWGLSGVVAPMLADYVYDTTGTFFMAYLICAVMMVVMLAVNFMFKKNVAGVIANG